MNTYVRRTRRQSEAGTVAIMAAVLATVLVTVAAMSVDLGNAWARKRDVQTQVDVSAMSAGHLLPQTAANQAVIAASVANYLNDSDNRAQGQPLVTAVALLDGNDSNGEILFSGNGTRMRVVAPQARVDFGLAAVLGASGTSVQASATVEVQTTVPGQDVLPFALPSGCPYGPGFIDTSSNGQAPPPSGSFTPPNGQQGSHDVESVTPNTVAQGATATITVTVDDLPNNSTGGIVRFHIGDTTFVDRPVTWAKTKNNDDERTVTVTIDGTVTNTPGEWRVWVVESKYSENSLPLTVPGAAPAPPPGVGCSTSASGNYGQLESPRSDEHRKPEAFALNIALGLDHVVVPFVNAPAEDCGKNSPIPGAILDKAPSQDGPNCLHVNNGNDGPKVMDGLISGPNGSTPGRLNRVHGDTRPGCGSNTVINGVTVNNDKLSCFLRNGATLAQIAQSVGVTESMLDPAVVQSPRFVWLPVFYSVNRTGAEYQPIKTFVPGMITDETATTAATSKNGIDWSGNKIVSIQVYTFNADALPVNERDPSIAYDPDQRAVVRLVD